MGKIGNDEKRDGWNGWKDYYSYWDAFVARWLKRVEGGCAGPFPDDELTPSIAHFFGEGVRNEKKRLVYDELPEPYYGDPERAKCVIIQNRTGWRPATFISCIGIRLRTNRISRFCSFTFRRTA